MFPELETNSVNNMPVILLAICTLEYFRKRTISEEIQPFATIPRDGCIVLADDHYERVSCNEQKKGVLTPPFDADKMQNFRKITDEDTITEKSIWKLYYVSINSKREYYTSGGNHPIYNHRVLRVLSKHIYETHPKKLNSPKYRTPRNH